MEADILDRACSALKFNFDRENGGFGQAPKFPQPMVLEFLLRQYYRTADKDALNMVTLALEKMAEGGIYDQLGGGFHRYSTDAYWLIPHFEKMLYDNALLSHLYLHAYLVTRSPLFRRIAEETIEGQELEELFNKPVDENITGKSEESVPETIPDSTEETATDAVSGE